MSVQIIPESAPFTPEQRAWLNGFIAGLMGLQGIAGVPANVPPPAAAPEAKAEPWHDETLPLEERMKLAEGRSYPQRLMAAMGQMDCGQCGYLCKTYAQAIAGGQESDLTLCVPGGKATARQLKLLVKEGGAAPASAPAAKTEVLHTRKNPFTARLKAVVPLTRAGSVKDIRHVAIDLSGSGIRYQPGDSLGVVPRNCPDLVSAILQRLGVSGEETVETPAGARPLRQVLSEDLDITKPSDEAIEYLAGCAGDPDQAAALRALAAAGADEGQDLLDLLEAYPSARPNPAGLAAALGRLQPRLYSIASSLKVHRDEAHLTVGVVRYSRNGRPRQGVASTFFADRLAAGEGVKVYIQPAHDFRLPDDGAASVIMVGPGTGIAPFRAFLQERQQRGDRGRNWLLFGNPHRASDFLYQEELAAFAASGLLTRLDTAFSRDQADKVYVQQRMVEQGAELWAWLQAGAYFYVCGDAKRMARDVDAALHQIAQTYGGLSATQAQRFVGQLAKDRRYLRDVY